MSEPSSHPRVHLSPRNGWMNDPNGLMWVDGVWHAFFQFHPASDRWGPMHWGHAVSTDLLHWHELPIALAPDSLGTIFSGSAVVDHDDSAGFGAGAFVAVFTQHGERQVQSLAWSVDGGLTWSMFAGNPVLTGTTADFRDPKVMRFDGSWVMVLAAGDHLEWYGSDDLRRWELLGHFSVDLPGAGAWECPDLVRVAGAPPGRAWLLTWCVGEVGAGGHGVTLGVWGDFDGRRFTAAGAPFPIDHGPDFYAFQTWWGTPGSEVIGTAWMNSWRYAQQVPSAGRRGVLALPRRLTAAVDDDGSVRLRAWPAARPDPGTAVWAQSETDLVVEIVGADGVAAVAGVQHGLAFVERFGAGVAPGYAQRYEAVVPGTGPHLVVADHGTLEVFAGAGSVTLSAQVFAGSCWSAWVTRPYSNPAPC